jgi:hypothetical protein
MQKFTLAAGFVLILFSAYSQNRLEIKIEKFRNNKGFLMLQLLDENQKVIKKLRKGSETMSVWFLLTTYKQEVMPSGISMMKMSQVNSKRTYWGNRLKDMVFPIMYLLNLGRLHSKNGYLFSMKKKK